MRKLIGLFLSGLLLITCGIHYGQENIQEIFLLDAANPISQKQVQGVLEKTSQKNDDGGYDADEDVVRCFAAMEYLEGGLRGSSQPVAFRMLAPSNFEPGKKYPLVLLLHGRGESGTDNKRQLAHLQSSVEYFAGDNKLDFFLVVPQCPNKDYQWLKSPEKDMPAYLDVVQKIMDAVIREYPVDPNAISVFGISSGAVAAWEVVAQNSDRFAALAVCSGSPPLIVKPEIFQSVPIRAFNNRGDGSTPYEVTQSFIDQINDIGGNATLSIDNIGGHDTWTRAMRKDKIIRWLTEQNRNNPLKRRSKPVSPTPELLNASQRKIHTLEKAAGGSFFTSNRLAQRKMSFDNRGRIVPPNEIVDLFSVMEYRYTGGRYNKTPILFRLYSPSAPISDKRYPLVLWFHDQSESGNDNKRQLAHLEKTASFLTGITRLDFYLLAVQCPEDNERWIRPVSHQEDSDLPIVIVGEIMENMIREFPIDENRVSLIGFGTGADATWSFIERFPGMVAAFAPCAGSIPQTVPDACLMPALWMFEPSLNGNVSYDVNKIINDINHAGGNAWPSAYMSDNGDIWSYPLLEKKVIGWLIAQDRRTLGPPQGIVCNPRGAFQQFVMFGVPLVILGLLFFARCARGRKKQ